MAKEPRLSKNSEELFWDKKAYKQCLWGYFLEIKKGKKLRESDFDLVWEVFNSVEDDANKRYEGVVAEKASNVDHLNNHEVKDLAMEITNARNFKALRKTKDRIKEGDFNNDQRKYLKKLYIRKRERLTTEAD